MAPDERRVSRYVQPADMWSQLQPVLDGVTLLGGITLWTLSARVGLATCRRWTQGRAARRQ